MARIITKGLIAQEDINFGSGTFTRATSTGGTQTLHKVAGSGQVVAVVDAVAQAANIGSTALTASATGGFYELKIAMNTEVAATTSSTRPIVVIGYTDADSSQVESVNVLGPDSSNVLTKPDYISVFINAKAATAINYSTTGYLSVGGTAMQYALHIRLMGPM